MFKNLTIAITMLFAATTANATTIEMLNKDADGNKMVYSQEIARVAAGDTITWVPTSKGHNVEIVAAPESQLG